MRCVAAVVVFFSSRGVGAASGRMSITTSSDLEAEAENLNGGSSRS